MLGGIQYLLYDQFITSNILVTGVSGLSNAGVITPILGSELVVNGDMTSDEPPGTAWAKDASTIISGGIMVSTVLAGASVFQNIGSAGQWYFSNFDLVSRTAGSVGITFGSGYVNTRFVSTPATYTQTGRYAGTARFYVNGSAFSGTLDNVSLKLLSLYSLFSTQTESTLNKILSCGVTLTSGTQAGLVINLDSASSPANFIIAYHDGTNVHFDKCVAGTYTALINTAATYVAGAIIRVVKVGNVYGLYYNGTKIGADQTVSDAAIVAGTLQGLFSTLSTNSFSSFLIMTDLNGTQAEPTGGTRTVVDTNSKLSISGGIASFSGSAGADNPSLRYQTQTRVAGMMAIGSVTFTNTLPVAYLGWNNNVARFGFLGTSTIESIVNGAERTVGSFTTGVTYAIAVILKSSGIYIFIKGGVFTKWSLLWYGTGGTANQYPTVGYSTSTAQTFTADNIRIPVPTWLPTPLAYSTFSADGATSTEVGTPDNDANYNAPALPLTGGVAAGGVLSITPILGSELIDGWTNNVTFPFETFTSIGSNITSGINTSGFGFASKNIGAVTAGTWNKIEISTTLNSGTIPALIISEVATGGSDKIVDVALPSGNFLRIFRYGIAHANEFVSIWVANNVASNFSASGVTLKPLTLSSLFSTISTSKSDIIIDVNVTLTAGTQAGLVLNLDSASSPANFVIAYHDGTNVHLDKCVAGVYTSLINTAATYSAGATIRVIKYGAKYRLYYANNFIGSEQTISDSLNTNTIHGMFSTYSGNTFDLFTIFPRGTGDEFSQLDQY